MKLLKYFPLLAAFALASNTLGGDPGYSKTGYVFGYGGAAFGNDLNSDDGTVEYDFDGGFIAGGGVGLYSHFLGGSRFELEGLHLSNDLDSFSLNQQAFPGITGDISVTAVMVNLLKEFPIADCLTAYAGGGIGYGSGETNLEGTVNNTNIRVSGSESVTVYQGIVGLDYCISQNLAIFTQYKYVGFGVEGFDSFGSSSVSGGLRVSF